MGFGCVAVLWAILGALIAGAAGLAFAIFYYVRMPGTRRARLLGAVGWFVIPFACLAWSGAVFVVYIFVSDARGFDPGIGDTRSAPLPGGYRLVAVDTFDQWIIFTDADADSGRGEDTVTALAVDRRWIYAVEPGHKYAIYDTARQTKTEFVEDAAFRAALARNGSRDLKFVDPRDYYTAARASPVEWLFGLLMFGVPCAAMIVAFVKLLDRTP